MQGWTSTKFMFLVLILNPKHQPWQGNILVRENIIINMVDTGILISFHNYWTEPTLQHVHLIVIYKVCEILSIIIANISQFDNFLKYFWFNWNWAFAWMVCVVSSAKRVLFSLAWSGKNQTWLPWINFRFWLAEILEIYMIKMMYLKSYTRNRQLICRRWAILVSEVTTLLEPKKCMKDCSFICMR